MHCNAVSEADLNRCKTKLVAAAITLNMAANIKVELAIHVPYSQVAILTMATEISA
jgi:hypothetical protein